MSRIVIVAAALLVLAGCGQSAQPGIEVRTVPVPVPVACVEQARLDEAVSAEPAKVQPDLTGDAAQDTIILGASAKALRAWGYDLLAIVKGCAVKPVPNS